MIDFTLWMVLGGIATLVVLILIALAMGRLRLKPSAVEPFYPVAGHAAVKKSFAEVEHALYYGQVS